MDPLDIRILRHIGRYTITLRRVLQVLFFEGGSPQTALNRLERLGYIKRVERVLPGNFSYYQLEKRGCALLDVSLNKAKEKAAKGIAIDLAALWFCCMEEKPRKRLTNGELRTLFGAPKGGAVVHIAEASEEEPTVYRLFVPEADSNLERFSSQLKRAAHNACADERLIRWIERGTYQFAVLLTNENRLAKLEELIRNDDYPDLRIQLAVAPSPRDLPLFISADKDLPS
jgi:hypothetical protein